jgi:hypothetical protein
MMAGDIVGGAKVYNELLASDKSVVDIALDDAYYFNEQGRYSAGKTLFNLVIDRYPDAVLYRQEFAASLIDNNMPRDAFRQYQSLAKVEGGEPAGLAGMAVAAVQVGDYTQAKDKVSKLQDKYAENALTLEALKSWENRRLGGMETGFVFFRDYKGNESQLWRIAGDQSIGGNFSVLVEATRDRLIDHNPSPHEKTTLNSQSVGLGFKSINSDFQLWYHSFKNNGTFSGYSLLTNFYPSDHFNIGFDITKRPLLDVQALNPSLAGYAEKRIMTTNYTLRTRIINGEKEWFDLSFTRGNYSDNNKVNSYSAGWTRTLKYNDREEQYLFINWGYDTFSRQRPDLYESPPQRDSYSLGFSISGSSPNITGKRRLPSLGPRQAGTFRVLSLRTPGIRLQLLRNRSLTAGFEYGGRTDKLNNSSSLHLGYRQYDLLYSSVGRRTIDDRNKRLFLLVIALLLLLIPSPAVAGDGVLILCYHDVGKVDNDYTISTATLAAHFDFLRHNGYNPISLKQYLDANATGAPLPDKPVLLTFDDGYISFYNEVFPLLKKYQFPAALRW